MEEATAHRKRPWFQLHLSTCVVLMVVAGVILGFNLLLPRIEVYEHDVVTFPYPDQEIRDVDIFIKRRVYGWPLGVVYEPFYEGPEEMTIQYEVAPSGQIMGSGLVNFNPAIGSHEKQLAPLAEKNYRQLALDALAALGILAATACACEMWIRRRERARAAAAKEPAP